MKRSHAESFAPGSTATLGDITGNVDTSAGAWDSVDEFPPLERVVLAANGNLQRLVSSYYNAAVTVTVLHNSCVRRGVYERAVRLSVHGATFGIAVSNVRLLSEQRIAEIDEHGLAIGQMFRQLNIMPTFELQGAGHLAPGVPSSKSLPNVPAWNTRAESCCFDANGKGEDVARFWRHYVLAATDLECEIHEVLRSDMFSLLPWDSLKAAAAEAAPITSRATTHGDDHIPSSAPNLGDIMAPCVTFMPLPNGFTPLQRMLLTANGNVERILSAYYAKPMQLYVVLNHMRADGSVYDRQSILLFEGRQLMLAKSTIFLTDDKWRQVLQQEKLEVGALFRRFSELPTFTLHSTGQGEGFFWRQYSLKASGMTCEINETFSSDAFGTAEGDELAVETPMAGGDNFGI